MTAQSAPIIEHKHGTFWQVWTSTGTHLIDCADAKTAEDACDLVPHLQPWAVELVKCTAVRRGPDKPWLPMLYGTLH